MKVSIHTLGCKVNQAESAAIEGLLRSENHEIVKHTEAPDVCIVNTCTVTAKSDYQSRQLIRKCIRSGAKVIATGCYAQTRPRELSNIKGITQIVGNSEKDHIPDYLKKLADPGSSAGSPVTCGISVQTPASALTHQPFYSLRSRAFLKIQDGCNSSCAYCAVPLARGRSRSMSLADTLAAADRIVSEGYREIVLTGIHIGSYGLDLTPPATLEDLINHLADACPGVRLRLSSLEPQELTSGIMELIRKGGLCPHLHIPLQSGSDRVLKAMGRGYTTDYYKHLINRIVTAYPGIALGTDIIVGFPGESDKDFNDTVNLINELPFSYLHVFRYSRRPDTDAFHMKGQISDKVKKQRAAVLLDISKAKKRYYRQSNLGNELDIIVQDKCSNTRYYKAISDNYLHVFVRSPRLKQGESLKVKVTSLTDDGLIAELLK